MSLSENRIKFGVKPQAKILIDDHLQVLFNMESLEELYPLEDMYELARESSIISCKLVREQYLLAASHGFWDAIIKEIQSLTIKEFTEWKTQDHTK